MANGQKTVELVPAMGTIVFLDLEAVIHVKSDGTRGTQWPRRLTEHGYRFGPRHIDELISSEFKPTTGVVSRIHILLERQFSGDITNEMLLDRASGRKLRPLSIEEICLVQAALVADQDPLLKENRLWNLVASGHKYIETALMLAPRRPPLHEWKGPYSAGPQFTWPESGAAYDFGFAFAEK